MRKKILLYLCVSSLIAAGLYFVPRTSSGLASERHMPLQQVGVANETCLACHGQPDQYYTMPSGEELYITIDEETYNNSVHGKAGYACVQCHTNIRGYPHPPIGAITRRDLVLDLYPSCARCHNEKYELTLDSVHAKALAEGNKEAAVCTDCHGAHNVQPPDTPRTHIPQTCERCHATIYQQYTQSVHGKALIGEGNPDVPTCIDCHGVHNISGPVNSPFHLFSPQICARCHADEQLMSKYGINTNVFDTYVADFHGTTVVLFEALAPDQETNKPTCVDCHGVHDMKKVDEAESQVIKGNLLRTCQRCHPGASENFSSAWLGHYIPDREKYPLVYFVDLFYKIFIPTILGVMAIFIISDIFRRNILNRRKEYQHGEAE